MLYKCELNPIVGRSGLPNSPSTKTSEPIFIIFLRLIQELISLPICQLLFFAFCGVITNSVFFLLCSAFFSFFLLSIDRKWIGKKL